MKWDIECIGKSEDGDEFYIELDFEGTHYVIYAPIPEKHSCAMYDLPNGIVKGATIEEIFQHMAAKLPE